MAPPGDGRTGRSTGIDPAIKAAWTMSSTHGLFQIQYNGAMVAMIGWKWSPSTL